MGKKVKVSKRRKLMGFIEGFKAFITKGNVVDMAIGVIIGGAFGKIVTSLVNDIILPPIGVLLGGVHFNDLKVLIHRTPLLTDAGEPLVVDGVQQFSDVYIRYGQFIQIVLEFLIIALVIYAVLFFIIRRRQMEEQLIEEELAKQKAQEELNEVVVETPIIPEDIQLLTEIRDLLKNKKDE